MYLINLYPVAAGGGLQNAYSFLNELSKSQYRSSCICIVRSESDLLNFCMDKGLLYEAVPSGKISRLFFELFLFRKLSHKFKSKLVFTLFGNPPLNSGKLIKISGFARSNIIENNVDFWAYLNRSQKIKMNIIDCIIKNMMRKSDVVILETQRLKRLSLDKSVFGQAKIEVVNMSPSSTLVSSLSQCKGRIIKRDIKLLYLSGAHPNKKIHELAKIISCMNSNWEYRISLITTLDEQSDYFKLVKNEFLDNGAIEFLDNRGVISPISISPLIEECDGMINIAALESFSNNWVEAWAANRLLICRNSGYAKESCGDACVYVDVDDVDKSAHQLMDVLLDDEKYRTYCENGLRKLRELPTAKEKFDINFEIIINNEN